MHYIGKCVGVAQEVKYTTMTCFSLVYSATGKESKTFRFALNEV